jgi:hypothetical protein
MSPSNPQSPLRQGFRSRLVLYAALAIPIAAWMVHLGLTASLAGHSCGRSTVTWVMHALTAGLGLVCVGCGLIGFAAFRRAPEGTEGTSLRFLGGFVVAVAVTNLVLILWEGSYTVVLSPCR